MSYKKNCEFAIAALLNVMTAARKYAESAKGDELSWEKMAKVYENAVFKELADLTAPTPPKSKPTLKEKKQ